MAAIRLRQIVKRFGSVEVIPPLDLTIEDHEFMVFVGPSGCGKSTLLRLIAGLEPATAGDIFIGERRVNGVAPAQRDIAMVFQDYALYPHMTVRQNMSFGLEMRKVSGSEIVARVDRAARMLHLEALLDRRPKALSGGQRQRVAMGRAIVRDPQAFLFDEPLSNLDAKLRHQVRAEIKALSQQLRTTIVFVTHDQVEAMTMADRLVVLDAGRVQQVGTPEEVYDMPANRFVAGFIGSPAMNFFPVTLGGGQAVFEDGTGIACAGDGPAILGIRPEALLPAQTGLPITVSLVEPLGSDTLVHFHMSADEDATGYVARVPPSTRPRVGDRMVLSIEPSRTHLFHPETGAVL